MNKLVNFIYAFIAAALIMLISVIIGYSKDTGIILTLMTYWSVTLIGEIHDSHEKN